MFSENRFQKKISKYKRIATFLEWFTIFFTILLLFLHHSGVCVFVMKNFGSIVIFISITVKKKIRIFQLVMIIGI